MYLAVFIHCVYNLQAVGEATCETHGSEFVAIWREIYGRASGSTKWVAEWIGMSHGSLLLNLRVIIPLLYLASGRSGDC